MEKTISLAKVLFTCGLFLVLVGMFLLREKEIVSILNHHVFSRNDQSLIEEKNSYYRDYDFMFLQNVKEVDPHSFHDLINVYYSFINSGQNTFTFYCPKEYENCINDIQVLANDQELLSNINNYVHPFNGFSHIETEYDTLGRVTITLIKSYTSQEIEMINAKIDELYPELVSDSLSFEENIRNVHDYIINHTKYDSLRTEDEASYIYKSDIAYGPLFEGYAICGGYTDLMELFLERMGLMSIKVSSEKHIWNAVYLGSTWYHLDLTWDDPVASDGGDYLEHNYFLIQTDQLLEIEKTQHNFNREHFPELKEAD